VVVVVDYELGNVRSVINALEYLRVPVRLSRDPREIAAADRLVLPGVGSFNAGMDKLQRLNLQRLLDDEMLGNGKPILGICLGMQLFATTGHERGERGGLGWIRGTVRHLAFADPSLRVPHIGYNSVRLARERPLLAGLGPRSDFYFLHSYYLACDEALVAAWCDYGVRFPAVIVNGNIFGTQFHPEKSQSVGLRLLENFARLDLDELRERSTGLAGERAS